MRRLVTSVLLTLLPLLPLVSGCRLGASVVRVEDGRPVEGRWISPDAYASFMEGALAEASGDGPTAEAHYRRALDEDPAAGEAWARLGAVLCTKDRSAADAAFSRARALDPDLGSVWLATAECDLARNDAPKARASAAMAVRTNPTDPEASRALVLALERAGETDAANRVRRAAALYFPAPPSKVEAVDEKHVPPPLSERALLAVRAGNVDDAGTLALRALRAEPGNTDALVAVLAARDLGSKAVSDFSDGIRLPSDRTPLSPLGRDVMRELLSRRAGHAAAAAFGSAAP